MLYESTGLSMLSENTGLAILEDIKSSTHRPYNFREVEKLKKELEYCDKEIEKIKEEASGMKEVSKELSINFIMLRSYKKRGERILKCYEYHRLINIEENTLRSKEEQGIFSRILEIKEEYLEGFSFIDFTVTEPPLDTFIQVWTLEDCGVVHDEGEFMEMKKGRLYFVRKKSIEHLIGSGYINIVQ